MVIKIIYYILFYTALVYGLYFTITGFIGIILKSRVKFKESNIKSKFAILVPARNEATVIANLIKSLKNLDYPKDKYDIYVIPNNCTDTTKDVAIKNGAKVLECNVPTKTKGDVLKFAFEKLKDSKDIDAYVIFDADNLVHKDFLTHMNNCLNSGYKVAEGYRDAKNPSDNWISGSYTIFYLFQNIFFNRARMALGGSSSINGTGFMISKTLIDEKGFETFTLTEDCEFTGQCALNLERIAFVEDAITYDEYPVNFKVSCKQRRRWSAGIIQCMNKYSFKLFKNFFKKRNLASLDMSLVYLGPFMQVLSFIDIVMLIVFKIIGFELNDVFSYIFASGIVFFVVSFAIGLGIEVFVIKFKNKKVKDLISGILLFFLFTISWIPINVLCFVKKFNKWEEIKHTRNISIEEI